MKKPGEASGQSGGIQSLDAALRVLKVLADQSESTTLSDLARVCDMPLSKVHRYLSSFQHAGLVEQAGKSGKYDLGPEALILGLSAIGRHDFVNRPSADLADLRDETGLTVLLSVYGNEGATVVRWERAAAPVVTSMGLGTTLPLLTSSAGRVFLAWGPKKPTRIALGKELGRARRNPGLAKDFAPTQAGIDDLVKGIKARGFASVDGSFIPGLVALSAPILDWQDEAQAAITLIGTDPSHLIDGSKTIHNLIEFCKHHSVST
ncbi:IclR family transcriptional regulator [uncultured Roseobacter sp.]|uniref:IclR family transcriptional regulator n=1 Tax=uncultured Roseobacter sp. TaxID=114847 RepID=UPI00262E8584|nr:IclR family transcriptional regulator [uncultured Roseobacter sp.]